MDREGRSGQRPQDLFRRSTCCLKQVIQRHDSGTRAIGLLDERGGSFGFRDLASARQIATLLTDGVRLLEIIRSVSEIRRWLPEAGLANVRLHPGVNSLEVEQLGGRTDRRGQFMLAVEESPHNSDALFRRAQSAEEVGDIGEAERLYRLQMPQPSAFIEITASRHARGEPAVATERFG